MLRLDSRLMGERIQIFDKQRFMTIKGVMVPSISGNEVALVPYTSGSYPLMGTICERINKAARESIIGRQTENSYLLGNLCVFNKRYIMDVLDPILRDSEFLSLAREALKIPKTVSNHLLIRSLKQQLFLQKPQWEKIVLLCNKHLFLNFAKDQKIQWFQYRDLVSSKGIMVPPHILASNDLAEVSQYFIDKVIHASESESKSLLKIARSHCGEFDKGYIALFELRNILESIAPSERASLTIVDSRMLKTELSDVFHLYFDHHYDEIVVLTGAEYARIKAINRQRDEEVLSSMLVQLVEVLSDPVACKDQFKDLEEMNRFVANFAHYVDMNKELLVKHMDLVRAIVFKLDDIAETMLEEKKTQELVNLSQGELCKELQKLQKLRDNIDLLCTLTGADATQYKEYLEKKKKEVLSVKVSYLVDGYLNSIVKRATQNLVGLFPDDHPTAIIENYEDFTKQLRGWKVDVEEIRRIFTNDFEKMLLEAEIDLTELESRSLSLNQQLNDAFTLALREAEARVFEYATSSLGNNVSIEKRPQKDICTDVRRLDLLARNFKALEAHLDVSVGVFEAKWKAKKKEVVEQKFSFLLQTYLRTVTTNLSRTSKAISIFAPSDKQGNPSDKQGNRRSMSQMDLRKSIVFSHAPEEVSTTPTKYWESMFTREYWESDIHALRKTLLPDADFDALVDEVEIDMAKYQAICVAHGMELRQKIAHDQTEMECLSFGEKVGRKVANPFSKPAKQGFILDFLSPLQNSSRRLQEYLACFGDEMHESSREILQHEKVKRITANMVKIYSIYSAGMNPAFLDAMWHKTVWQEFQSAAMAGATERDVLRLPQSLLRMFFEEELKILPDITYDAWIAQIKENPNKLLGYRDVISQIQALNNPETHAPFEEEILDSMLTVWVENIYEHHREIDECAKGLVDAGIVGSDNYSKDPLYGDEIAKLQQSGKISDFKVKYDPFTIAFQIVTSRLAMPIKEYAEQVPKDSPQAEKLLAVYKVAKRNASLANLFR